MYVCVAYLSVRMCVCVCVSVLLVVSELFLLINIIPIFFAFLYPRNLLPGLVTKPFLASVTQRGGLQHQDDHTNDKFMSLLFACKLYLPDRCVTYQSLLSMRKLSSCDYYKM